MEKEHTLLHFVIPSPARLRVLCLESWWLLPRLRELLPAAELTVLTRFSEVPELSPLREAGAEFRVAEWRTGELGLAAEAFDLILAEDALEEAFLPEEVLMALSHALTDTGRLLTQFQNIRYAGVLDDLRRGEFPVRDRRLWAKTEVVRLLHNTLFKEIVFAPGKQDFATDAAEATGRGRQTKRKASLSIASHAIPDAADSSWGESDFAAIGFQDFSHDLATKTWLVRADRATATVRNLKSLYTKETRAELARVLHRIEYEVEREENEQKLRAICQAQGIFPEYLEDFAREIVTHPARVEQAIKNCFA